MANAMKWGLIIGGSYLLWLCLEFILGLQSRYIAQQTFVSNLFVIPSAFFIVKGMMEQKQHYGGRISYRRSLTAGTGISLAAAALVPIVLWIFNSWVNPDFFPAMVRYNVSIGQYADDGDAASRLNLQNYILIGVLALPAIGLITSSIAGLFIRTRP